MSRKNEPETTPDPTIAPVAPQPEINRRGDLTVTFAYEVTTADGKSRKPDSSAPLPAPEALQLVTAGLARFNKE